MKANKVIKIRTEWLETLLNLAEQASKDLDKHFKSEKDLPPKSVSKLVGYASSVEAILKINLKINESK